VSVYKSDISRFLKWKFASQYITKEARLKGDHDEWTGLKGVYKARSKVDLELFNVKLADEAESGFRKNN